MRQLAQVLQHVALDLLDVRARVVVVHVPQRVYVDPGTETSHVTP